MTIQEITDYLNQKNLNGIDVNGIAFKLSGIEKDDLNKYVSYIQSIGRKY